jgi:hypothetical protein
MATASQRPAGIRKSFLALLVLAALSSALRDVASLRESTTGLSGLAISWLHAGSTVYASAMSPAEHLCAESRSQTENSADRFHWSGRVAPGQSAPNPRLAVRSM